MKKTSLVIAVLVSCLSMVNAQKIVVKTGNFDALKNEKFFNIKYDYSNMGVGKFEKEEDYLKKKVDDYNKDEPGKGDEWKKKWIGDRTGRFDLKFEELLNKYLNDAGVFVGKENSDAKYTVILHTYFTEPGFNIYITKKPAIIHVKFFIVESANPDNVLVEIISKNNQGRTYGMNDMDTGIRLSEAYAKCGKELGKYLTKNVWK